MSTIQQKSASLKTIEQFIAAVSGVKSAESNTEAGGHDGPTTHPVKSVDDKTKPAVEGARAAENAKDVKKDQGAAAVDGTAAKAAEAGSASADQIQIGTKKAPTGEDPENETEKAKPGKEDPGTAHPAKTTNDSLNGGKYANDDLAGMSIEKLAEELGEVGNAVLGEIMVDIDSVKTASAAPAARPVAKQVDARAGWNLAGLLTGDFDKQAADAMVQDTLVDIIKEAEEDATNVAEYLAAYEASARQKAAEGFPPPGDPMAGDPMAGGPPPGDPAMAGGPPGDPAAAGGEPDGDEGGVDEAQLMQILQELGVTPEELEQALQEEQGRDGGGAGAPVGAGAPGPGMEATASDKAAQMANYVSEVVSRSRANKAAAAR